jgi:hypothetical protein
MNDEYLWQKTGTDPETKRLEEALTVFRYRTDDPPALPVTRTEVVVPLWRAVFGYAVTAFAVVTLAAGMWFELGRDWNDYDVTFIHHPAAETTPTEPPPTPVVEPAAPKQPVRRRERGVIYASVPRRHGNEQRVRRAETVVLTAEEKYAYDRLMLALSISSSQMKIARDAINGVDESDTRTPNNR